MSTLRIKYIMQVFHVIIQESDLLFLPFLVMDAFLSAFIVVLPSLSINTLTCLLILVAFTGLTFLRRSMRWRLLKGNIRLAYCRSLYFLISLFPQLRLEMYRLCL